MDAGEMPNPDSDSKQSEASASPFCPYEIQESPQLGRFLVASRDLQARTLIIREKPMVCGAADSEDRRKVTKKKDGENIDTSVLMCLGCFTQMVDNAEDRCSKCGWPVCNNIRRKCETVPIHAENECKLFQENKVHFHSASVWGPILYKSILVLRCYLLKFKELSRSAEENFNKNDGKSCDWNELLKFEHHNDIRTTKADCVESDRLIIQNVKRFLRVQSEKERELEKILEVISGIINVNAFTTVKENEGKTGSTLAQCIYKTCTLFNHSCVPNSTWSIGSFPDFQMTIRTAIPISKGEMFTIPYSIRDNQHGTLQRLISTEDVAHFTCQCSRCTDKTELGTFVSGIKCMSCHSGFLLPINSIDANSLWKCTQEEEEQVERKKKCDFVLSVHKVVRLLNHVETQIESIKRTFKSKSKSSSVSEKKFDDAFSESECRQLEELKDKCEKVLHRNHYIIQEICYYIVKKQAICIRHLNEEQLKRFTSYCDYLLAIANVLNPGYCRFRAFLQFYLSRALSVQVWRLEDELLDNEENLFDTSDSVKDPEKNREFLQDILNCYKRIQYLENEAFLFFQSDSDNCFDSDTDKNDTVYNQNNTNLSSTTGSDAENEKHHRKYYLDQILTRMRSTQNRIEKLEKDLHKIG